MGIFECFSFSSLVFSRLTLLSVRFQHALSLPAFLQPCLQSLLACTLPSSAMRSRSVGVLSNSYYLPLNFLPAPHRSVTFLCFGLYACSLVC